MPSMMDTTMPAMDVAVLIHAHNAATRTRKMQQRITGNKRMGMRVAYGYRQQQRQQQHGYNNKLDNKWFHGLFSFLLFKQRAFQIGHKRASSLCGRFLCPG